MKPQTEKLSDGGMRFFTPELYLRFNSDDDRVANEASEAWEVALLSYRQHLEQIRDRLPSHVRRLAELSLHDAELLAFDQESASPGELSDAASRSALGSITAIVSVRRSQTVVSLIYLLSDRIREVAAPPDWRFSPGRKHWLYDELDLDTRGRGTFLHRILYSDGNVVEIPFSSVLVHTFSLTDGAEFADRMSA